MDPQEFQDPERISAVWVKNLNSIVNKINNTKSWMIGMKSKNVIKLDIMKPDISKTHPKEVLPEDGLYRHLYQNGGKHGNQKKKPLTLSRVKIHLG